LVGFIGVVVSVTLAAGAASGTAGVGPRKALAVLVWCLLSAALLSLITAAAMVVKGVLLPSSGFTIAMAEVERYPYPEFIQLERVWSRVI